MDLIIQHTSNRWFRYAEFALLFILLPALMYFELLGKRFIIPLVISLIYCLSILLLDKEFDRTRLGWNQFKGTKPVLLRFAAFAIVSTILVAIFFPERLFDLPQEQPGLMLLIWIFYPLWSVLPQEVIFRPFFFHRYEDLFPSQNFLILINAICFGFVHIIFGNWIAVVGTILISLLLAWQYDKHRSLMGVSLEHALFGNWVFTVGLGSFFYYVG
ncbi:MAG: CPBP family intramembrane glutamic endopeptidase [Bacteroidota bacterium]